MRLVIDLGELIEFCEPNSGGPHPYLIEDRTGELVLAARAGQAIGLAGTESSSLTVAIENCRKAAALLRAPIRRRGWLYDDNDDLAIVGIVASITYADFITLEIGA